MTKKLITKEHHTWTRIGKLEWSEDWGEMDWDEATKKCKEMGGRLPTRVELIDLHDNHREECEEMEDGYWSSTESSSNSARGVNFNLGLVYNDTKTLSFSVRCVREVKEEL